MRNTKSLFSTQFVVVVILQGMHYIYLHIFTLIFLESFTDGRVKGSGGVCGIKWSLEIQEIQIDCDAESRHIFGVVANLILEGRSYFIPSLQLVL